MGPFTKKGIARGRTKKQDHVNELPDLFAEMLLDYEVWEEANDVLPMPEGYNRGRTIFRGGFN